MATTIYKHIPIFIQEEPSSTSPWAANIRRMYDMSYDSHEFHSDAQLKKLDAVASEFKERRNSERTWLRLFESKLMQQFDHRFATFPDGVEDEAAAQDVPAMAKTDAWSFNTPRYWVSESSFSQKMSDTGWSKRWILAFRMITNTTNERTAIMSVLPRGGVGNSCYTVTVAGVPAETIPCLVGCVNSCLLDWVTRQKLAGTNLNSFVFKQLPIIPPDTYSQPRSWARTDSRVVTAPSVSAWLLPRVLELSYTAWDLEPFAKDCGYDGPPFKWDEDRRFQLRAELDAAFFHLYLPSDAHGDWLPAANESPEDLARLKESFPKPYDAVSYIMDTFPIVRRKDIAKHGTYHTKDMILKIYEAMQTAIRTGIPYQTPLNPPPGPPTDANGQFIPFAQWTSHLNTSHIHPPRVDRRRVELGRLVLDLLLLLKAWNKPVSITVLEPALLLMRNEAARKALLAQTVTPSEVAELRNEPRFITGIDRVYQAVEANGAIRRVGDNGYELAKPELLKDASQSDRDFAAEVIQGVNALNDLRSLSDFVAQLTEERYEVTV